MSDDIWLNIRHERVTCADGFNMSVQAHYGAYCEPRINHAPVYQKVEVGFPSAEEPLLMDYADEPFKPTATVYAYVPVHVVTTIIAKHGGMTSGSVPPGVATLRATRE